MTEDFNFYRFVRDVKVEFLGELYDQLGSIEKGGTKEIYFHDIGHKITDSNIPENVQDCATIIDDSGYIEYVDEGLIDKDRGLLHGILMPMAYDCTYQEIFEDKFFQYLQDKLNNEHISYTQAQIIQSHIDQYRKDELGDTEVTPEYLCEECGNLISFGSEGQTFDYEDNENDVTMYTCEECLIKLRAEAE